jgi:hypothetical protein
VTKKYIKDGWQSYRKMVIPGDASPVQIRETKQAFYAGASLLWYALMATLDADAEPTEADMRRMDSINKEIEAYGQKLDRDVLGIVRH